jgi:TolB-like protein/uncharacterized caspase-like protein
MRRALPVVLVLALAAPGARAETRRFAIILGNNAGAGERPPLRYAENDAGKMARVLAELGDVAPDDMLLLQGRTVADLEKAVVAVRDGIDAAHKAPDTRAVLIFYFSGHSDGESLELGAQRLPYARLKAMLSGTGAELRVSIIDACRSGAAIAQKGGKPAPPFTIRLADQIAATGEVMITSSAADESALESSEVAGSYFTHNFVSGLRGAADISGDRLVTLAEAYRYAYDRTVSATAGAPSGTQHPLYDYRLSGQGELVLTSLATRVASLTLPAGAERALVSDLSRDQVVAEVLPGGARELALSPGSYGVRLIRRGESFGGRVTLSDGQRVALTWQEVSPLKTAELTQKGAPAAALPPPRAPTPTPNPIRLCVVPFKNLGNDPLQIGDALEEMVYTEIAESPGVKLVERGQIDVDIRLLDFDAKYADPATRAELGRLTGAEVALLGGYQVNGKVLRVTARFIHVQTGEVLQAFRLDGTAADALGMEERVAHRAREAAAAVRKRLRP